MSEPQTKALAKVVEAVEALISEHGDDLMCVQLVIDARNNLMSALKANIHEDAEAKRDAREERRYQRAEDGYRE